MKFESKVIRNSSGIPCFEVRYKERPYKVKLYKFQENLPDGTLIDCVITTQSNGDIFIRQNISQLLRRFYEEGETYEFTVRHDFTHNGYYELVDERGIPFHLPVPKGMKLLTGSTVQCKMTRLDSSGCTLKLVEADGILQTPDRILPASTVPSKVSKQKAELDADAIAVRVEDELFGDELPLWDIEQFFSLLYINDDYYDMAVSTSLLSQIRGWMAEGVGLDEIAVRLGQMEEAVMYVLEGSTILLGEELQRRKSLQRRLAGMAVNLGGYRSAAQFISEGRHEAKVDHALRGLRTSGYIYEAEKQLDMMMRLFSLSTDFMKEKMADIFDIIHARDEEFWRDEPFRKSFVRLLQIYVEQSRKGLEDSAGGEGHRVQPLLEALSIQLLLADREGDSDLFDYNLNLAAMYRYASWVRTSVPANALRNAFLALMDVTRRPSALYKWGETRGHDLIASKLTMSPVGIEGPFEKWYANRQVVMSVTNNGITIGRTDVAESRLNTLDLNGVGVWPGLKIRTSTRIADISGSSDLRRAKDMWNAIEKSLFSEDEEVRRPLQRRLPTPGVGDDCMIRITSQVDDSTFRAEITDDEDFEGRGTIAIEDMVKYKVPGLTAYSFCDSQGRPYVFRATVKRVDNGNLVFSTFDYFTEYTHDQIDNTKELLCIVKSINQYGIVGISEWGDSVRFKHVDEFDIRIGDVVRASYWRRPENSAAPYIDGVITGVEDGRRPFSTERAFINLLSDYCESEVYEDVESSNVTRDNADSEDLISDGRMREMMALTERKAAAESDYMKAYNHIGFARLLALLARDGERREFYATWMRLISILHHFAVNGEVDQQQLSDFEANDRSRFDESSELYRRYLQLKIVSYKGRPQMREELWEYMSDSDEDLRGLAENVMAFNLLCESASMAALGEISDRINNILKVQGRKSTLHSFGSEDKTKEFKTSLIFPPNNHMRANPEVQTIEIMKELCALLNAEGGTLYLGVNDFGMGVGIENDLAYKDFNGSEDKYDLYFRHAVCRVLGRDVDAYVDAGFETFGGKRIYIVTVKPYYSEPVKVDGVIYERHGSSKLPFYDLEDIRLFTQRRRDERDRMRVTLGNKVAALDVRQTPEASPSAAAPVPAASSETPKATKSEPEKRVIEKVEVPEVNPERIATRSSRRVCPATFDPDHDPATMRYVQILRDEFMMVPEFYGYGDEDLLLSLPVTEDDVRRHLVMGYADGTVCRLPMRVLLDKEDYATGRRYTGAELIFVDILGDDEALLTMSEGKRGTTFARADRCGELPEVAGMRTAGERLFNTDQNGYVYDVLSGAMKLNYIDLFDRTSRDAGRLYSPFNGDKIYAQMVKDGIIRN